MTAVRAKAGTNHRSTLRAAVASAILAPSGHNTQPWRFRIGRDTIELRADRSRALAVADPDDRELTVSCGAALFHLRLAVRHAGFIPEVLLLPDKDDPDLLARVRVDEAVTPSVEDMALFNAIPSRRTNRRSFALQSLPDGLVDAVGSVAEREGVWLATVDAEGRQAVAALVEEGDRMQWSNPEFRRELATWLRPARCGDGLAERYLFGLGPLVVRALDLGRSTGRADRELVLAAPLLLVLGTAGDGVEDWLAAGQALAGVLLRAAADGVHASYFNQPVQVSSLRPRLRGAIGVDGWPQVVLRLGYGGAVPSSPRRQIDTVLEGTDEQHPGAGADLRSSC